MKVTPEELNTLIPVDSEYGQQVNYSVEEIAEISEEQIVAAYAKYFASCALSKATLLIPTKCTEAINNAVKQAAGKEWIVAQSLDILQNKLLITNLFLLSCN